MTASLRILLDKDERILTIHNVYYIPIHHHANNYITVMPDQINVVTETGHLFACISTDIVMHDCRYQLTQNGRC